MTDLRKVFVALFALVACSPHKVAKNPPPPVQITQAYSARSEGQAPERWWKDFGDSRLNDLVGMALRRNFTLKAAFARMKQAKAVAAQAGAARLPTADLSMSARRSQIRSPFADAEFDQDTGIPLDSIPEVFAANQFSVSLAAAYELDLWNKLGSRGRASALDALAARDGAEAAAMTLVAQVSDAYFNLVLQNATKKLLAEQLEVNNTFLQLTKLRFEQGLASALDIYQQQQLVVGGRSRMAVTESAIAVIKNQLAVLTGRSPNSVELRSSDDLPDLPPLPGLGIPADLLVRRPDVRAARRRVEAADHRVAAAVADRLPGLRLSGNLTMTNGDLADLISRPLYAIGASLLAPLFDGGRRKAEVVRNRAAVEEALSDYGQALLVAISEVENALIQERQQALRLVEIGRQLEISGNALREARARYRRGLSDFLPVLTALQNQQASQLSVLQAQRQAVSYRLQLMRALGGMWTRELDPGTANQGAKK